MINSKDSPLTKKECLDIIHKYEGWNAGQVSLCVAQGGIRNQQDTILDAKRELYLAVLKRIKKLVQEEKK